MSMQYRAPPQSQRSVRTIAIASAIAGAVLWLIALLGLPAPLVARMLLAAPLVVVPLLLTQIGRRPVLRRWGVRSIGGLTALVAALPLLVAFALPPGIEAALLSLPWLTLTGAGAFGAARDLWAKRTHIVRMPGELVLDAALGYLLVGAVFLTFDRAGLRPLGFPSPIILLTAVHFHVAGFGLTVIAGLTAERLRGRPCLGLPSSMGALGLVAGMPLTAIGFVSESSLLRGGAGLLVAVAGTLVACGLFAHLPDRRRWQDIVSRLAGGLLLAGMVLAAVWAADEVVGLNLIDIETMARTHGALNGLGVLLAALALSEDFL